MSDEPLNGLREDIQAAVNRQVYEVQPNDPRLSFQFQAPRPPENRADALAMAADHFATFGSVIAQAGLALGDALRSVPREEGDDVADAIINHMRGLTAGAAAEAPVPVTALAYIARVIHSDDLFTTQPSVENLIGIIEEWAAAGRTMTDLRSLYAEALRLTTHDVNHVATMLEKVKEELRNEQA